MDYTEMSVGRKLARARALFLKSGISKSGKNLKMEFKYFELEDILKYATPIFDRVGLINDMNITTKSAVAKVYNADDMGERPITFSIPYGYMDQIVSKMGNTVTNNIQALGGSVTYLRRYLWLLVLEVIEPDMVDPNLGEEEETPIPEKKSKPKPPATVEERKEAKKELTSADGQASEEQIKELKSLCKELLAKDEAMEDFVQKIVLKTDSFSNISASACEELSGNIREMIIAYGE